MEVTPIKKQSVAEQIYEQLRAKIIGGELRPGDQLPTEAELCQMYLVSRTSVRQALGKLSSLGLVEAKVGGGTFIKEADGSQVMDKLILHAFLNERSLAEIVEFRHLMEPAVTRLACRKASDEDIRELSHIFQRMEAAEKRLEESASQPKTDLLTGLKNAGISVNQDLVDFYTEYCAVRPTLGYDVHTWDFPEPPVSTYSDKLINGAKAYSDTAVIVISRIGGEFADLLHDMSLVDTDPKETYKDNFTDYQDFPKGSHYTLEN